MALSSSDSPRPLGAAPLVAVVFVVMSCVLFPFGNVAVKYLGLSVGFPVLVLVWSRYAGQMASVLLIALPRRGWTLFSTNAWRWQLTRSCLLLVTTTSFFLAIQTIPLGMATAINFTYPCLMVALAAFVLKEKVGRRRWSAVGVCFFGALLIIRPDLWDNPGIARGQGFAMITAVSYAFFQIASKRALRYDDVETTNAYTALVGTLVLTAIAPPLAFANPEFMTRATGLDWSMFFGVGFLFGLGHYFIVRALDAADASVVAPVGYVHVGTSALAGWMFFQERLDALTLIGSALIVLAGGYFALREARVAQQGRRAASMPTGN